MLYKLLKNLNNLCLRSVNKVLALGKPILKNTKCTIVAQVNIDTYT
jgi:hypothetical protein